MRKIIPVSPTSHIASVLPGRGLITIFVGEYIEAPDAAKLSSLWADIDRDLSINILSNVRRSLRNETN